MTVASPSTKFTSVYTASTRPQAYGLPSRVFFILASMISAGFLATQVLINGIREKVMTVAMLDKLFFSGAYQVLAPVGVGFLLLSSILLGLTLAMLIVRGWLHMAPCRNYGIALLLQLVPWVYFLAALFL
jgi:hypothetical protein